MRGIQFRCAFNIWKHKVTFFFLKNMFWETYIFTDNKVKLCCLYIWLLHTSWELQKSSRLVLYLDNLTEYLSDLNYVKWSHYIKTTIFYSCNETSFSYYFHLCQITIYWISLNIAKYYQKMMYTCVTYVKCTYIIWKEKQTKKHYRFIKRLERF